jgi:hypothetical protein
VAGADREHSRERRLKERYGALLGAIVVAYAIQGIANPGRWEQAVMTALLGVTLVLAYRVADAKRWVLRLAVAVVGVLIALSLGNAIGGSVNDGATRIADALLVIFAPPAIIIGVIRTLRARQAVTVEAVLGVLCVYILVGMFFAYVYGSIDYVGGSPFFAGTEPATVARCLYFSFASLTTVGYGDLTARTNLGHTLSVSEALLGQVYLVTVVSLIVANLGRHRPASPSS